MGESDTHLSPCNPSFFIPSPSEDLFHKNIIGGADYRAYKNLDALPKERFFPKDPMYQSLIEELPEILSPRMLLHSYRCGYITHQLTNRLGVLEDTRHIAVCSTIIYLWPYIKDQLLARIPLSGDGKDDRRHQLSSLLKQNSDTIRKQFGVQDLPHFIETIATLISGTASISGSHDSVAASASVLAIMMDREAWWDRECSSTHFYNLVKWLEKGAARLFEPKVVRLALRFMVEVAECRNVLIEHEPDKGDDIIKLFKLRPGMVLKRSILTFSGEDILSNGCLLTDEDILKLWRVVLLTKIIGPIRVEPSSI